VVVVIEPEVCKPKHAWTRAGIMVGDIRVQAFAFLWGFLKVVCGVLEVVF